MGGQATAQATALVEESPVRWRLERRDAMRVPGIVFASERLLPDLRGDRTLQQVANVATLPGIVGASYAMPDVQLRVPDRWRGGHRDRRVGWASTSPVACGCCAKRSWPAGWELMDALARRFAVGCGIDDRRQLADPPRGSGLRSGPTATGRSSAARTAGWGQRAGVSARSVAGVGNHFEVQVVDRIVAGVHAGRRDDPLAAPGLLDDAMPRGS
jgi:hypothetical protein